MCAKRLCFTNNGVNIQEDHLPNHGPVVNMIQEYQESVSFLIHKTFRPLWSQYMPECGRKLCSVMITKLVKCVLWIPEGVKVCKMIYKGCWIEESS